PITSVAVDAGRRQPDTEIRVSEPDLVAGRALASALGVPQAQVIRGEAATNTEVLGEVHSPTIRRLVEVMLEESDNVLAEALARQVAIANGLPASFEGGAVATERVLAEDNFVVNVSDGSGLSLDNRISPAALVAILQKSITDPKYSPIASGMPVGSYSGTLYTRFNDPNEQAAAGKIRAKTGTLNSVSSLAGYVTTAGGRVLSFAAIANGYPEGADEPARNALDELSAALAQLK
ncbi:MAG: D-alanyl-D-alanine carboxypeptidase/D-alanyl-D-alanine-endopeptidase, partial [Corynebacteriales bacterium]|nr:D-alanyl-D-alanine carboxypeptidase/D-alanyl-D-alanine-endopeptidase [Mycobacteriales bacterium]